MEGRFGIDHISPRESHLILNIMTELVQGFQELSRLPPAVTIFGSTHTQPHDPTYALAEQIGRRLILGRRLIQCGYDGHGRGWFGAFSLTAPTGSSRELSEARSHAK